MRRRLTTLKAKSGASQNGSPRSLIDEAAYREHGHVVNTGGGHDTSVFSGWSWATRPRDSAIHIRRHFARGIGPSAPSGPT